MLYLKVGFVLLIIVFVGVFVYKNYAELSKEITMYIPPVRKPLGPSPMILYFSFSLVVGMILTGFPLLIMAIKNAAIIKKQKRMIDSLKNEISQLSLVNQNLHPAGGPPAESGTDQDEPDNDENGDMTE